MNDNPRLAAVMAHLTQALPGIPPEDLPRFAHSLTTPEPYAPAPESQPAPHVPRGTVRHATQAPGAVYPGVPHAYAVYTAAQLDPARPAPLMVFLDGPRYLGPEIGVPAVLDTLAHRGELPPMVAVFVQPGATGPGLPVYGGSDNRSLEYDIVDGDYARFLLDELLPEALQGLNVSTQAADRAICGISSGGCCAFNVAWTRPDAFGKVVSHCGSFVDIRGGHTLAPTVRRSLSSTRPPMRVFLQTGRHDLDILFGRWLSANQALADALAYRGHEHRLVIGDGGHSLAHGGALFPDTLRWLWRAEGPSA